MIDPAAQGNIATVNAVEKRGKEDFLECLGNKDDLKYMYKIVQNSIVLKLQVTLHKGF